MCLTLAFEIYVTFRRSVIYGLSLYRESVLTAQLSTAEREPSLVAACSRAAMEVLGV